MTTGREGRLKACCDRRAGPTRQARGGSANSDSTISGVFARWRSIFSDWFFPSCVSRARGRAARSHAAGNHLVARRARTGLLCLPKTRHRRGTTLDGASGSRWSLGARHVRLQFRSSMASQPWLCHAERELRSSTGFSKAFVNAGDLEWGRAETIISSMQSPGPARPLFRCCLVNASKIRRRAF
jgi:hypothetical protein